MLVVHAAQQTRSCSNSLKMRIFADSIQLTAHALHWNARIQSTHDQLDLGGETYPTQTIRQMLSLVYSAFAWSPDRTQILHHSSRR
jgi:hypothetical protein